MNVEIGAEAALFPQKEYINGIAVAVKDIKRYRFLIFLFWSWISEKSSKLWAAKYKNASNLKLLRHKVCISASHNLIHI